jgi:hypothetical protein
MSGVCEKCGATNNVESHHIKYVPEKTVPLCRSCHKSVHASPDSEYYPKQQLGDVDGLEKDGVPERATPTVKEINSNKYVYWQWREGGKIRSEYIGSMDTLFENITAW